MGKDEKTYLRGYHAPGLVNNIPIFRSAATPLALAFLEHRYNTFLRNITISHLAWHKIPKDLTYCCKNLQSEESCGPTHGTWP
jgi:hypothetical protein